MIASTLGENEIFYRVHDPQWARKPLSGMGPAKRGGRFNRPGQEALYLSREPQTALAEFQQDNPWLPPGTICSYFAGPLRVADLSGGYDPSHWDAVWLDFDIDWRREAFARRVQPVTWTMGDLVLDAGLDGILFPSQAFAGGTNLVVYGSSLLPPEKLRVHDPQGALPRDGSSWRWR